MKLRKILSFVLATVIASGCIIFQSTAAVTSSDYTAEELECSSYDIRKYTEPFWEGNIVYNEIVHPIRNKNGSLPTFQLMYEATEIVSVKDYKLKTTYVEGVDYMLISGNLCIIEDGNIPVMNYNDMHPSSAPAGYGSNEIYPYYPQADGSGYEYWTSGSDVCSVSLAVTYIHNDTWDGPIPTSQESNLPGTFEKLKNDDPITIVVAGDSVATGAMSSGFLGISPSADAFPEMTKKALSKKYSNDNITLVNSAIGGTMSYFDENKMNNTIIQYDPDLVIINFGMNDSSCDRVGISGSEFRSNLQLQIDYINKKLPDCEILLVSSLYGNRYTFPAERYEEHADVLHILAEINDGVGVADPQMIEKYLIEEIGKDYICFTADNMVHPGDLGMRLMAQTIVEALSFEDISTYRAHHMNQLTAYADIENQPEDKAAELVAVLEKTEEAISVLDEEWDINAVVDNAYYEMKVIIIRCEEHTFVDTVIEPTCKSDGYTHSVCEVCGYKYDHDTVPNLGGEHIMDSGRQTVIPTYKTPGEITYTCARCHYSETDKVDILKNPTSISGTGMVQFSNSNNYMASNLQPYTTGSGFVEFDFCPLNIENYDGTPYVGVWFCGYAVTACYNFVAQQVQIVETTLPFGGGIVHASADYSWTSNGGEYEYNWKKFTAHMNGTTVRIYIDGELILEDTKSFYRASSEVALVYSNGACYMDNFKVVRGKYDPTTGTLGSGGTILGQWDFNSRSSYNSFFNTWGQQYASKSYVVANGKNITTGHYKHTEHSGSLVGVVENGCGHSGYCQYACNSCKKIYFDDYIDPVCDAHTLINRTVTVKPTTVSTGECSYECDTCNLTFTEKLPMLEDDGSGSGSDSDEVLRGDVDNDGALSMIDYSTLSRFIVGGAVDIDSENSDVNGDGAITAIDMTVLTRKLTSSDA